MKTNQKKNQIQKTARKTFLLLVLALACLPTANANILSNQLKNHASPYLALHGNDPVQWQDWGKPVIDRAQRENKLIFISSGYFSCHWCHVMQRESYSDTEVASQLHQLAIPVKIDRELQPALDAWLIDFTERTAGQAGWPLNVFLTPDGYPLIGMTYLPKDNFTRVLTSLRQRWSEDKNHLRDTARAAFNAMKPAQQTHTGTLASQKTSNQLSKYLVRHALQLGDSIQGGFGDQNKFPMSPQLLALIDTQQRQPNEALESFLTLTLDQMANLGLQDHIGGGFYRYVIDPGWDIPHFEKMLYDNAQLARVYLRAAHTFKNPEYQKVALTTLDFILADMRQHNGGYSASLSAVDDKDVEGGYYLWHKDDLEKLLNKQELGVVQAVWGASGPPHLEDGYHLKVMTTIADAAENLSIPEQTLKNNLERATTILKQARSQRNLPVDHKVLASWNGLLLTSLSEAAIETGNKRYRDAAKDLYHFLTKSLWDGDQLYRFLHQGKPGGRVSLEDYAYVTEGILAWAEIADDPQAWEIARKIALAGHKRFHNQHGWQLSEKLLIPYDARELVLADSTMPSPSATLLRALLNIASHYKDTKLRQSTIVYIDSDFEALSASPLWYASHIALIAAITNPN